MSALICQARGRNLTLITCDASEDGGYRCERTDPHTDGHYVGQHTVTHALAGSGYTCASIDATLEEPSGCRWCGTGEREHASRFAPSVGQHRFEPPTSAQRLARMRARQARRMGARVEVTV